MIMRICTSFLLVSLRILWDYDIAFNLDEPSRQIECR
jgi:hypothetical protein